MPYKDKDKQREYQRLWVRQKRAKAKPVEPEPVEPWAGELTKDKQVSRQGFND